MLSGFRSAVLSDFEGECVEETDCSYIYPPYTECVSHRLDEVVLHCLKTAQGQQSEQKVAAAIQAAWKRISMCA